MSDPRWVIVTVEDYDAFINWLGTLGIKMSRDVAQMCDPALESFNDFSDGAYWPDSIICRAWLMDDARGDVDPRPADQRKTNWWRENTAIRRDWFDRWERDS